MRLWLDSAATLLQMVAKVILETHLLCVVVAEITPALAEHTLELGVAMVAPPI